MMNKKGKLFVFTCFFIVLANKNFAQSETLTSSPYSLYGLGVTNYGSTGKTNALGNSGIAMPSDGAINNLNPASYATFLQNSFLYDIGVNLKYEILNQNNYNKNEINGNFSGLAFGFPLNKKSGIGITLTPYTNTGYSIESVTTDIEGTNSQFTTDFTGSGGLNNLKLNYGYALNSRFRLGLSGWLLFGNINQTEMSTFYDTTIEIEDENTYSGFRIGTGFQYDMNKNLTLGGIVNLPTELNTSQTSEVIFSDTTLDEQSDNLDNYKLPLEVGLGAYLKIKGRYFFNIDYKLNLWSSTNQSDNVGEFVNQQFFGFGLEYKSTVKSLNYFNRINYRLGFNYDDGNLSIDGQRIENYAISIGLGLPFKESNRSALNFTYSYGSSGLINNGLIKENYHSIGLNISLEAIWFLKKKIY